MGGHSRRPGQAMPPNLASPSSAYAQLQPHQLLPQPSRPALQALSHPQLASVPPSLALQPSPEAHAMPLGPVPSTLPLQCPATNLHKPGSSQQCPPPAPDTGAHNGYPEGLAHTPQRRFQHASAVILQLQPASPVVSKPIPRPREQRGRSPLRPSHGPLWDVYLCGLSIKVLAEHSRKEKRPLPNLGLAES